MPYAVDWYIEDEVVYVYYSGVTTADEVRASLRATKSFIDQSSRRLVHVMIDVGDITEPVSPMESLRIIREEGSHERAGWQLILREKSVLIKMGVAFGTSVMRSRSRTFSSVQEAEKFLHEIDNSLSWDKLNVNVLPKSG